ncbi:MAG TPA: hypothetical protein VMU49_02710 [Candidatus Acidoferrales bacterium]|nr:hypothetical protein [Candidatus Acidoferrales bacterium]
MAKNKGRTPGGGRRPTGNRDGLLDQVVSEFQRRIPPDFARRIEDGVSEGQRVLHDNLSNFRRQVGTAASRAEVERLTRRLDQLTEIVEAMVSGAASGARSARSAQRAAGGASASAAASAKAPAKPAPARRVRRQETTTSVPTAARKRSPRTKPPA